MENLNIYTTNCGTKIAANDLIGQTVKIVGAKKTYQVKNSSCYLYQVTLSDGKFTKTENIENLIIVKPFFSNITLKKWKRFIQKIFNQTKWKN